MSIQAQDCIDIEQIKTDLSNIVDKCSCADPLELGARDQTTYISNEQLGSLIENECIEIKGTLVIDTWTEFRYCDFIMDDGALIKTVYNGKLSFINCNLQSCDDYFWNGIELGWLSTLVFSGNTMQHAFKGIHSSMAPVWCYVNENVFNNNRHAIKLGDQDFLQLNRSGLTLNGNIFGQSGDLKMHWEEDPHWSHEVSYGVETNFAIVTAIVGNNPCDRTNIFVGLHDGFYLKNSISRIESNLFHDFRRITGNFWGGSGITSIPSRYEDWGLVFLDQKGWPTNHIETFKSIDVGIWNQGSGNIQDNIIKDVYYGITTSVPLGLNMIKGNKIYSKFQGINGQNANTTTSIIASNIIEIEFDAYLNFPQESGGIFLWSGHLGDKGLQIKNNSISLNDGYAGIKTLGNNTRRFNIS